MAFQIKFVTKRGVQNVKLRKRKQRKRKEKNPVFKNEF